MKGGSQRLDVWSGDDHSGRRHRRGAARGAERVGDPSVLFIALVLPDGPAEKAGLKQGDQVTTVDGAALTGKTYEQVALMVRGEPGTVVKLG